MQCTSETENKIRKIVRIIGFCAIMILFGSIVLANWKGVLVLMFFVAITIAVVLLICTFVAWLEGGLNFCSNKKETDDDV